MPKVKTILVLFKLSIFNKIFIKLKKLVCFIVSKLCVKFICIITEKFINGMVICFIYYLEIALYIKFKGISIQTLFYIFFLACV